MALEISVVIPTYNRAALLRETLNSILSQNLPPREVIVVDDGSTDCTPNVIGHFGSRVHYHRIENSGVCRARNVGIGLSQSPRIALCDSDDLWAPDYLRTHAGFIEKFPEIEFAFANFVQIIDDTWTRESKFDQAPAGFWENANPVSIDQYWIFDKPLYESILAFQPIFQSCMIFSKALFDRIGPYDESLGRIKSEDLEFTLRCVQKEPIGAIREPLVGIRRHAGNFSGDRLATCLGEIAVLDHALTHHDTTAHQKEALRDEIVRRSADAANLAFTEEDLDLARQLASTVPRRYRTAKMRIKLMVSRMPGPVARFARGALVRLGRVANGASRFD